MRVTYILSVVSSLRTMLLVLKAILNFIFLINLFVCTNKISSPAGLNYVAGRIMDSPDILLLKIK